MCKLPLLVLLILRIGLYWRDIYLKSAKDWLCSFLSLSLWCLNSVLLVFLLFYSIFWSFNLLISDYVFSLSKTKLLFSFKWSFTWDIGVRCSGFFGTCKAFEGLLKMYFLIGTKTEEDYLEVSVLVIYINFY